MVGSPPANTGVAGWIPVPGRSHMLQGNEAPAPPLLNPCILEPVSATTGPPTATAESRVSRAHALQQEKPPQ